MCDNARSLHHFVDGATRREQLGGVLHRLCHREVLEQPAGLHDGRDHALGDGPSRRHAVDFDLAGGRLG